MMTRLFLLVSVLASAACATEESDESGPLGFPPGWGNKPLGARSVYKPTVEEIVLERRSSGFGTPAPSGPCNADFSSYRLSLTERSFAWDACDVVLGQPPTTALRSGARMLDPSEWSQLEPTLMALVVETVMSCGADKPELALIVTDGVTIEYADAFYGCPWQDKPTIRSVALDAAHHAFDTLAH
jgi:hypothetical protein